MFLVCREIDPAGFFKEGNFVRALLADYIPRADGLTELQKLKMAWGLCETSAIHFIAFFIHSALIKATGPKLFVSSARSWVHADGLRNLEAEYKCADTGGLRHLLVVEGSRNDIISTHFGSQETLFYIPDCVQDSVWKEDSENFWDINPLKAKLVSALHLF